jgi:hypothetical protein
MYSDVVFVIVGALIVVGLVTVVVLATAARTAAGSPKPTKPTKPIRRRGPLDGARDVIGASIGMYVIRRVTGRPTVSPPGTAATSTAPDAVTRRESRSTATRDVVTLGAPSRAGAAAPPAGPEPRERLVRDAGMALIVFAALGLVVAVVLPRGPSGQPGPTHLMATPADPTQYAGERSLAPPSVVSGAVLAATATPLSTAGTPSPVATSMVTATGAVTASPAPTPRSRKPTPTPTQAPTPESTPASTPAPSPTQTPTPTPTPIPTPEPTPTSTPIPTSEPTPTPTSTPVPS